MKKQYLLLSLFLFFLFLSAHAQSKIQHRLTAEFSRSNLHLPVTYERELISATSRGRVRSRSSRPTESFGAGLGYMARLHPRWEVAARINYAGNTVEDDLDILAVDNILSPAQVDELRHPRKYRSVWIEGLVFWRVIGSYSKADLQIGTGVSYLYYRQSYLSGYVFDIDRNIFDVQSFAKERKAAWGIPVQFQLQYPINPTLKVGANVYINNYFNSSTITGVKFFGTYRW